MKTTQRTFYVRILRTFTLPFFLLLIFTIQGYGQTITVNSIEKLKKEINNAKAGKRIIVKNGSYTTKGDIVISGRKGTSSKSITITAESIGGVTINGQGGFRITNTSEYITIRGFIFKHKGVRGQGHAGKHCLITRNVYELSDPGGTNSSSASYLKVYGPNNEISYNTFRNKNYRGPMVSIQGPNNKVAQNNWIHHNYFDKFPNKGTNDNAAIQPGYGALQESVALLLIEHNLFNNLKADAEGVMSVKCKNVTFRYNTVKNCNETVVRNGGQSELYGNYYFGGSGIRFSDADNKIYNNVFVKTGNGIKIFRRRDSNPKWDDGYSHDPTNNSFVGFNTMIGCEKGIYHDGTGDSKNIKLVNNIFYDCGVAIDKNRENWQNPTIEGNITWNTSKGDIPSGGFKNQNPQFNFDANGVPSLKSNSPVIGKATGNYRFVEKDIDGQNRSSNKDIGADQFSSTKRINKVLSTKDVGPNAKQTVDNTPKTVAFIKPSQNVSLKEGYENLEVEAVTSTNPDQVSNIKLYVDEKLIREEKQSPYEWGKIGSKTSDELLGLSAGKYTLKLVASFNDGTSHNKELTLTVGKNSSTNQPPIVSFKTPSQSSISLPVDYNLYIEANAKDPDTDGEITGVTLLIDGVPLRTERRLPYDWGNKNNPDELNSLSPGKHTLILKATDDKGDSTLSDPLVVIVAGTVDPDPNPVNCSFNTPSANALPAFNRVAYSHVQILGKGGPDLRNFRRFTINWNNIYNDLYQFSFNTTDGIPSYYVDLSDSVSQNFSASKPIKRFPKQDFLS